MLRVQIESPESAVRFRHRRRRLIQRRNHSPTVKPPRPEQKRPRLHARARRELFAAQPGCDASPRPILTIAPAPVPQRHLFACTHLPRSPRPTTRRVRPNGYDLLVAADTRIGLDVQESLMRHILAVTVHGLPEHARSLDAAAIRGYLLDATRNRQARS